MQINQWIKLYWLLIIALTIGFAQTDITLRNPLPTDASLNSVCWNGSMFVAVGARGTVLTSIDGTSWVRLPSMPDVGGWKISVYTPAGKKITSSDHINAASFEIGHLPAKTYLVEIRSDH